MVLAVDDRLELGGHAGKLSRSLLGVIGTVGRALGRGGHPGDVLRDFRAALGRLGDVAADLVGRGGLLLDRAGDGVLVIADLVDHVADLGDGRHRALGIGLDGLDLLADVLGSLGCFFRQFLDFVGDVYKRQLFLGRPSLYHKKYVARLSSLL